MRPSRRVAVAVTLAVVLFSLVGLGGLLPASAAPRVGDEHQVATSADNAGGSSIAYDGTNYLQVWTDIRGASTPAIHGALVAPDGSLVQSDILISAGARPQAKPDVVFDGTDFFVVWQDGDVGSNILGARVSSAGVVRDAGGLTISDAPHEQSNPKVAYNGSVLLVAWNSNQTFNNHFGVFGGLVSPDGTVLTPASTGFEIIGEDFDPPEFGDVASDGTNFVVAASVTSFGEPPAEVLAATVTGDGTVTGYGGITSSSCGTTTPAADFDGVNYLFVWVDGRNSGDCEFNPQPDIYGARVTPQLTVLDPSPNIQIASGPSVQTIPQVAWNGAQHLIAYKREAAGDPTAVKGTYVGADGKLIGSPGFVISSNGGYGTSLAIAAGPGRDVGVAYERHVAFSGPTSTVLFRAVAPK